tara:strand:+ start:173 stop:370 length:198 start_codon:yes stop_codon:yes gene_type:complete
MLLGAAAGLSLTQVVTLSAWCLEHIQHRQVNTIAVMTLLETKWFLKTAFHLIRFSALLKMLTEHC